MYTTSKDIYIYRCGAAPNETLAAETFEIKKRKSFLKGFSFKNCQCFQIEFMGLSPAEHYSLSEAF